jgi:hypothetical protein
MLNTAGGATGRTVRDTRHGASVRERGRAPGNVQAGDVLEF